MWHIFIALELLGNKNITANIYRIQAYNSIIYGYFCIGFIDFMLNGKSLLKTKRMINNIKAFSITKKLKMKKNLLY